MQRKALPLVQSRQDHSLSLKVILGVADTGVTPLPAWLDAPRDACAGCEPGADKAGAPAAAEPVPAGRPCAGVAKQLEWDGEDTGRKAAGWADAEAATGDTAASAELLALTRAWAAELDEASRKPRDAGRSGTCHA